MNTLASAAMRERQPGPSPDIATERLLLRPLQMNDAEAIAQSMADFSVTRMLSTAPYPYALEDAVDWLNIATAEDTGEWSLAITQPADHVLIGVVSIELRKGGWHLGYWLNRYYWGRSFMSEAVSGIADRFFRRMGDITLHSGAFAENPASLRVQQKLGFQVTGLRDTWSVSRGQMLQEVTTALKPEYFKAFRFS